MSKASDTKEQLLGTYPYTAKRLGTTPCTLRRWVLMCAVPDQIEIAPGVHRFYMPDVIRAIEAKRKPLPEELNPENDEAPTEPGNEKK